jgi:hypothetical protein
MTRRSRLFVLVALVELTLGCAAGLAAQSAEQVLAETLLPSEGFKLVRVWTNYAIYQKGGVTASAPSLSGLHTVRPRKGSIFVLVNFELVAEAATIAPILLDSVGTRYTPLSIAPFSTEVFTDLSGLKEVRSRSPLGHWVEVRDIAASRITVGAGKPGTRVAAVWEVPEAAALQPSELKLDLADGNPILIDTLASARTAPLHEAARAANTKMITQALAEGIDVNETDDQGWTLLHAAAKHDVKSVAELLLVKGAQVNAKDRQGRTPLHLAAGETLRKGVAEVLLARGAEVDAKDNDGQTPLHLAALIGNKGVAELLLVKGAEVNARGQSGTPLHTAALTGNRAVAELLLAKGAEVDAKNKSGKTPLDVATTEAVKVLLRKYGAK